MRLPRSVTMESSSPKSNNVARTRRGPYRKYAFYGSDSQLPASTKRHWRQKLKSSSGKQSASINPICTEHRYIKDASSRDGKNVHETGIDEESELSSDEVRDCIKLNRQYIQSGECIDSEAGTLSQSCERENTETMSTTSDVTEDPDPKTNYTDDFLIMSLLALATKLRYNLTYEAAESVFKLTDIMNETSAAKPSKYFLKKIIHDYSKSLSVHRICDECKQYAGVQDIHMVCLHCGKAIDNKSSPKSDDSFMYVSLTYQLTEIFETTTAHENCEKPRQKQIEGAIEDIYDGTLYKRNYDKGMISINFSVDGAPVFESSNTSIYPILCTINELEPRKRNRHVLLCGLWFGSGKPPINEFLKPFVAEANKLYNDGFNYVYKAVSYSRKCRVLAAVCDSVARPMLRNSTQFNGQYGCGLCLHPGENIDKDRGRTRVYPLTLVQNKKNAFGEGFRSHEQTLEHAKKKEKGIKSRSILCDIPGFDIVQSLEVDWMHAVNLGVCRQFAKLWFDSSYHDKQFYIGRHIDNIDELLLSYTPTLEISRTPRAISDRVHWKAHEWAIWLLFYSLPTLRTFLPQKYVKHWALLVDGIQKLCKTSIMKSEILRSHRLLIDFIGGVEELYGKEHISFNVHLLAHLGESVTRLGPLWTHSAFVYENSNQILLNYVNSSKGVAEQISETVRAKYVVDRLRILLCKKMTKKQRLYLDEELNKKRIPQPTLELNNAGMLGAVSMHATLPRAHHLAFQRANVQLDQSFFPIKSYKRAIIRGEITHSKSYTREEKRLNCYVQLISNEIFEIQLFYIVKEDNNLSCYALGRYFENDNRRLFAGRRLPHLLVLGNRSDDLAVINVDIVKEKVIVLPVKDLGLSLACIRPNRFELLT